MSVERLLRLDPDDDRVQDDDHRDGPVEERVLDDRRADPAPP